MAQLSIPVSIPGRALLLSAVSLLGLAFQAAAQTFVPVPFVTAIAGQPYGGSFTTCSKTADIPDAGGNHFGDGCLPTQATIADMFDVKVDPEGNIYIAEGNITLPNGTVSGNDIRVIYKGGAVLTAVLKAANVAVPNFNPIPGHIYTLGGGLNGNISAYKSLYYCNNGAPGTIVATDNLGDGCPAAQTRMAPRGLALDQYGNIYFVNVTTKYGSRIIYAGGAQVAKLITLLNPAVTTPQVGYMYQLGFNGTTGAEGDNGIATNAGMIAPRYIAVDSAGNVYIEDGTNGTVTNGVVTLDDSGENVRMINGTTGIVTTVAGETACGTPGSSYYPYNATTGCPGAGTPPANDGDGGPATSALFNYPSSLFLDQYNNLFIGEATNKRLRVLYRGGTLAGIPNPVVGNIYTYAGGNAMTGALGTLQVDGTPAQQISFSSVNGTGIDKNGNIYIYDSGTRQMWKIDSVTGIGNIIAGGPTNANAPVAGKYCNGGTTGPVSTDSIGSGCPGTQAYVSTIGSISFDAAGNFYITNVSDVTTANEVIQELSYQNQFPSTPDGTAVPQYLAFSETASTGTTLTSRSFSLQGGSDSEYTDAGGTTCSATSAITYKNLCVVNVNFTPAHPGARPGLIQLNSAAGVAVSEPLIGTGVGSDLAIDDGTVSTIGTGLTPSGVAADFQGNVYVSDSKGGQVLKGSASGTALTPLVTGLKNPSQIAVDNYGNLYIADTGNNRVLITTPAGATIASVGNGLSAPQGVAVDGLGNLFVADTGNNRIVTLNAENYQLTLPVLGLTPATPALSAPTELGFDPTGNLYILDSGNNRILEAVASTGITSPVTLDTGVVPTAFAIDAAGDIYVTDSTSQSLLDYYAGTTPGFALSGGFQAPVGLAIDNDANIFVADTQMSGVFGLRRSLGGTVFPDTTPGQTTNADLTVNNVGNSPLSFTKPLYTVNSPLFSLAPATTNGCAASVPYTAGSMCNFTASFSPALPGPYSATATFITNAANTASAVDNLSGPAVSLSTPTNIVLSIIPATGIAYSLPVTLTAVVSCGTAAPTTGTVTLTLDGKTKYPPSPIGNGSLKWVLPEPFGTHQFTATYSGGGSCASSTSSISVTVTPALTKTTLAVAANSISGSAFLTFTSTVSVQNQTAVGQSGTVTIWAGAVGTGTEVCSGPMSANTNYQLVCDTNNDTGNITNPVAPAPLTYPPNTYIAVYSGSSDGNFTGSQSSVLTASTSDFAIAPALTTFTIAQGGVGTLNINLVSVFASAGTVTPSCTGLPANSVCRFSINSISLASNETPVSVQVQVYTDVSSTLASNERNSVGRGIALAFGLPLGISLLLVRKRSRLGLLALLVICIVPLAGVVGCTSVQNTQTFSNLVTPAGAYSIQLVFTGSNGLTTTHSVPATFTVLPAPTVF